MFSFEDIVAQKLTDEEYNSRNCALRAIILQIFNYYRTGTSVHVQESGDDTPQS